MVRAAALLLLLGACATSRGRLESDVVFARYSRLSRTAEVARRALPPLTYRRIQESVAAGKHRLSEQPVDLSRERFDVLVPGDPPPPAGYGLVVFIAPWSGPTRPQSWRPALDRHRLILVSGRDSGNDTPVLDRRLPLAILAHENVRARYPIDVETRVARRLGHQPLDATALDEALDAIEEPRSIDPAELARCDARVEPEIAAELERAAAAIARGDREGARRQIKAIDARFGGLAARGILALDDELARATTR